MKIQWYKIIRRVVGFTIITLFMACQKTDLPPSSYGDPILFVRGKFKNNTVDLTVGKPGIHGTPSIYQDSMINGRIYNFTLFDSITLFSPTINLSFVNYSATNGSLTADIDSTFKPGNKVIADFFNSPTNPFQLNTFTFELNDNVDYYSSRKIFPDTSECKIDSVKDLTWHDGNIYKLVYMSFSLMLVPANVPQDSSKWFRFTEGKATIAFPKK